MSDDDARRGLVLGLCVTGGTFALGLLAALAVVSASAPRGTWWALDLWRSLR